MEHILKAGQPSVDESGRVAVELRHPIAPEVCGEQPKVVARTPGGDASPSRALSGVVLKGITSR